MTNELAIRILTGDVLGTKEQTQEAVTMAVRALTQQDVDINVGDTISRQAAIELAMQYCPDDDGTCSKADEDIRNLLDELENLPSAQPTLYGYKIEHLAYIAMVMKKEGVTADYAVRTFDDMSRAIKMIIDETQQKVEEALRGIKI